MANDLEEYMNFDELMASLIEQSNEIEEREQLVTKYMWYQSQKMSNITVGDYDEYQRIKKKLISIINNLG